MRAAATAAVARERPQREAEKEGAAKEEARVAARAAVQGAVVRQAREGVDRATEASLETVGRTEGAGETAGGTVGWVAAAAEAGTSVGAPPFGSIQNYTIWAAVHWAVRVAATVEARVVEEARERVASKVGNQVEAETVEVDWLSVKEAVAQVAVVREGGMALICMS